VITIMRSKVSTTEMDPNYIYKRMKGRLVSGNLATAQLRVFYRLVSYLKYCDMHAYLRPLLSNGPRSTVETLVNNRC
jgi:hypothetical protein